MLGAAASTVVVQGGNSRNVGARCSDLILYPVSAVDQSDQYRFDYSDVSFGNTHAQGATVAITCTTGGQPATVEGYDQFLFNISDLIGAKVQWARIFSTRFSELQMSTKRSH
ncbi:hypothetical protein COOONC_05400 [Cooperia oncophora]